MEWIVQKTELTDSAWSAYRPPWENWCHLLARWFPRQRRSNKKKLSEASRMTEGSKDDIISQIRHQLAGPCAHDELNHAITSEWVTSSRNNRGEGEGTTATPNIGQRQIAVSPRLRPNQPWRRRIYRATIPSKRFFPAMIRNLTSPWLLPW